MCKNGDRHHFRSSVGVRLTDEQTLALQQFLPEQEGLEAKLRYLLGIMADIAESETQYRIPPSHIHGGRYFKVRIADELYLRIKKYGKEGEVDETKQATSMVVCGLEVIPLVGGAGPLRKEELTRRIRQELERRWGRVSALN